MSIMANINYLKKMNAMPCTAPDWYVIIETGIQAAPPALLSLFTPGCTDIVKMKLGISPWHARGIRSAIKSIAPPGAIGANQFLYKIGYFAAERGLYYLMLADVTTQFITTWQTLVFEVQQCPLPSAGTAYGFPVAFAYTPGHSGPLGIAPLHLVSGVATTPSSIGINPGFQGTLAFDITFESYPTRGEGVAVSTWITEDDDPTPIAFNRTGEPPGNPPGWTGGSRSFNTLHSFTPKIYYFHYSNDGDTFAQPVAGAWTVNVSGINTGVLPWGCKPKKTSNPFT